MSDQSGGDIPDGGVSSGQGPEGGPEPRPRIAIAHDWLVGLRGGERVLDRVCLAAERIGEVAAIYTMFDDGRPLTDAIDRQRKIVAPFGKSARVNRARRWLLPAYPLMVRALSAAVRHHHLREEPIDLLVSTHSAAIKGLRPPPGAAHLCYCHSPARYLWSQAGAYAEGSGLRRAGLALAGPVLRRWDKRIASRVTKFLANSTPIAAEIERVYGRDASVVFPPARTAYFTPDSSVPRESFWLFVGAIEPYKRLDLAIAGAKRAGARLVVVGDGSEAEKLRQQHEGDSAIDWRGRVDDEELRRLYRAARLLIFPQIEDFGIIPVEAQACGTPVLARRAGGALDTVIEGQTGAFFDEPDADSIAAAAAECPMPGGACRRNAEKFNEACFDERIEREMLELLGSGETRRLPPRV